MAVRLAGWVACCFALSLAALGCGEAAAPSETPVAKPQPSMPVLRNPAVGYSLTHPRGWKVVGQVVATEFAVGAACQSVQVTIANEL